MSLASSYNSGYRHALEKVARFRRTKEMLVESLPHTLAMGLGGLAAVGSHAAGYEREERLPGEDWNPKQVHIPALAGMAIGGLIGLKLRKKLNPARERVIF